ncbi:TetR/AcrR family transcriptional regulator [Mycobacterium deserti]|uniref:TetR/AcrR family transcriptional regulator n=1 Tax=Mycobacterium deserti TaxID=2978347 RepID=A0ABT2M530_9MYCO|nr:TetR/AcrR family transcriptional regulator [Mycobacterium deserti]MCT7657056.1 TetR/AcrR family transcriptional regulator [Mycobacterium deserti]
MADVVYLRSYDDRGRVDDTDARRALNATVELLREIPYENVTMSMIAKRAGVRYGGIRAHFGSKDAIVAEIYLDRLRAAPLTVDVEQDVRARIAEQFCELVMLLADEPGLAAACSAALIGDEPGVRSIRHRINAEYHRRVCTALRSGAWPEVTETLHFGLIGALVQAGCGRDTRETADALAGAVAAVLPDYTP